MLTRRRLLTQSLFAVCSVSLGCGTILHPERRGQPAGPLDWSIVALDAVGLLFFFVPGVIAFAVDFNNGTIYLPPDHYYGGGPNTNHRLSAYPIEGDPRNVQDIEKTVSELTTKPVALTPGGYQTQRLSSLDDFWTTHAELVAG